MRRPRAEELQTILVEGRLDRAVAILQRVDATVAADTFLSLPYEDQEVLFRRLTVEFAARLAPIFPYYHTFVLLHTLNRSAQILACNILRRPRGRRRARLSHCWGRPVFHSFSAGISTPRQTRVLKM